MVGMVPRCSVAAAMWQEFETLACLSCIIVFCQREQLLKPATACALPQSSMVLCSADLLLSFAAQPCAAVTKACIIDTYDVF
jgi:hypothetical protein